MFSNCKNSKKQGDLGLGIAIAHFTQEGLTVSLPLTDSQDYDLVVDLDDKLMRVQVKTTSQQEPSGGWSVGLRITGGNQSWSGVSKFFDPSKTDYLFVVTQSGRRFFIPTSAIKNTTKLVVGKGKYCEYEIDSEQHGQCPSNPTVNRTPSILEEVGTSCDSITAPPLSS